MIDRKYFFDDIKKNLFHSFTQDQVDGLNHLLDTWGKYFHEYPYSYLAYCLATAFHETARTMRPIEEYGHGKGRTYGQLVNGHAYYGRGYVQLTWDHNYRNASEQLKRYFGIKVDLVKEPEKALDPDIAAMILYQGSIDGWFTGKKLFDYFGKPEDPINARKIINGLDKANLIAGYYKAFKAALKDQ